jgi:addiction module HigA family antidote
MKTANNITPTHFFHPGLVLAEEIEYRGMSRRELADVMGVAPTALSEIITGKRNITTSLAIKIEEALGINALFFLNMQVRYEYYTLKERIGKRAA